MADDHISAAEVAQHRPGNFAGKRALLLPMDILRTEHKVSGSAQGGPNRLQCRKRRRKNDFHGGIFGKQTCQFPDKAGGLRGRFVHLPVADNESGTHGLVTCQSLRSGRATRPGSGLPSSNSSAAPPPVEMKEIFSDSPARWIAMAVSPPPTIVRA